MLGNATCSSITFQPTVRRPVDDKKAANLPGFFHQLGSEIRRRKVVPVVVTYAIAAWVILQLAEVTFEPLGFPDWSIRVLIVAAIAGFPGVFALAWLIDFRQEGMMFDLPLWSSGSGERREKNKISQMLVVLLCVLLIVGTYGLVIFLLEQFPKDTGSAVDSTELVLPPNSIAVLAFENFDGSAQSDYFAAGLSEEILNFLAGMKELNVAARTSSFQFRGEQVDIRDVARLLSVKHVLEGSVRRENNRIRVTAQLIDGVEGYHDWSKTYDRDLVDIFAIQQEIAAAVVNELKIALSVDSEKLLQSLPQENVDAYIFYLEGRERLRNSIDADVVKIAKQLFNKALEIDPSFSRAYAGICEANLRLYQISNDTTGFEEAEEACGLAQSLNPGLNTEVRIALGRLYRYRGWYEKAIAEFDAVIAASPTAVDAYIERGEVLVAQDDRLAAEAAFLRAIDLKRNYWRAHEALASFYYNTDRYSESAEAYEIVTSLTPDVAAGFDGKAAAYWMLGDTKAYEMATARSLQLKPTRAAYTNSGLANYYAGRFVTAAQMQKQALKLAPDDHRIWGRLAESYRFVPGKEVEAKEAYERAAVLAAENLKVNREDWVTRSMLGLYYAHLGRVVEAGRELDSAAQQSGNNPEVRYMQALALLQMGDAEGALDQLEESIKASELYRRFLVIDPDLQSLRENERYAGLLHGQGK
jgi:TolB-like protein/tetratricopeptide (TPR) repeat protein